MNIPNFKLNNGVEIPAIGFGCSLGGELSDELLVSAYGWLRDAIENGFRHFDTAYLYGTEGALSRAIKDSGIPRSQFFITTKLSFGQMSRVQQSFEQSLRELDLGYIDLYLVHWPFAAKYEEGNRKPQDSNGDLIRDETVTFNDVWAEMEKIFATGKTRAIGVSNFSIMTMEKLLSTAKVIPAVNQVEMHPYLAQTELKEYCESKGILIQAYTATGRNVVRSDPTIGSLAAKYGATPAQVILSWHVRRGVVAITKSRNKNHQKENLQLLDLSDEDFETVTKLDRNERVLMKADERGRVLGWTYDELGW